MTTQKYRGSHSLTIIRDRYAQYLEHPGVRDTQRSNSMPAALSKLSGRIFANLKDIALWTRNISPKR